MRLFRRAAETAVAFGGGFVVFRYAERKENALGKPVARFKAERFSGFAVVLFDLRHQSKKRNDLLVIPPMPRIQIHERSMRK